MAAVLSNPVRRRQLLLGFLLLVALLVPLTGEPFYTKFATRILIMGMAALAVDILLGYAGLLSFGHAAFLGIGAYATGMLTMAGYTSILVVWPIAVLVATLAAAVIGALSLRTTGLYFIMITLAFAQMVYYVANSMRAYGGADGFPMYGRNLAPWGVINTFDPIQFYYLVLALLVVVIFLASRTMRSRFGVVIRGSRDNQTRAESVGFPSYRYKLVAFTISGAIAGLAGVLLANLNQYIAPDGMLSWIVSGDLLVMVILGGAGTLVGPVVGAAFYLFFAEMLTEITEHWMLLFGPLLIARVLLVRDGLYTMLVKAVQK